MSSSATVLKTEEPVASPSTEYAVEVENVTVSFRAYKERPTSLKESILKFIREGRYKYYSTFNALENVSFKVPRGQIVGIIGSNGAGKSTLLRTISGTLPPGSGKVTVHGELDSLIKLGAGFDSELNAIENIYLYGSLHGFSRKEIKERVPKILEFAELEEFAQTPIKYYSSGMYARLGFSCAIDTDPDVLLVDEVLAVGDARFNNKCKQVFSKFLNGGKTIIMVSHGISMLEKTANQIGVLSKGRLIYFGDPSEAVRVYNSDDYESALDGKRLQPQAS